MLVALTSSQKALLFALFLVLLPTVPLTIALTRALRRRRLEPAPGELTRGRAASTPFRLITIVGSGIAGALIGWQLAKAGARVVILEAGPPVDRSKGPATAFANLISTTPEAAYPISPWAPSCQRRRPTTPPWWFSALAWSRCSWA